MSATIQSTAVTLARAEEGYREGRGNWSKFARDTFPDVQNQAWCGSFVGDTYRRAGWDCRGKVWMPFVPYIESWARGIGAWKTDRAQLGDIVVYGFGKSTGQHTGISWPDESTGGDSYRAIEGNTSSGNGGSQTNGDGVYVRRRRRSQIRGWVDMAKVLKHYGVSAPAKPAKPAPAVKPETTPGFPLPRRKGALYYYGSADGPITSVSGMGLNTAVPGDVYRDKHGRWHSRGLAKWQQQMIERGWSELERDGADGRFGETMDKVVGQFQELVGLTVDHEIGPKTWAAAWEEPVT